MIQQQVDDGFVAVMRLNHGVLLAEDNLILTGLVTAQAEKPV